MYSTNTKNPSTAVNIFRAFISDDAQDLLLPVPVLQYHLSSGFLVVRDEFDYGQRLADQVDQVQRSHLLLELWQFLPCVLMKVNAEAVLWHVEELCIFSVFASLFFTPSASSAPSQGLGVGYGTFLLLTGCLYW
jgi:hypothetical protein